MVFTIITAATLALASGLVITTFDGTKSTTQSWYAENDPVMGGVSNSTFTVTHNVGVWQGEVKVVPKLRAPGFCTARTQHDFPDLSAFDGLIVTASADASANSLTNFKMTLESSAGSSQRGGEFEGKFQTHGASSTQYFIPFASMTQSYRGQPEGGPPTKKQLAAVTGLGFISDGVAGPFGLMVLTIEAGSKPSPGPGPSPSPPPPSPPTPTPSKIKSLIKIKDGKQKGGKFVVTNDPVMGGASVSNFTVQSSEEGRWAGEVKIVQKLHAPGFCRLDADFEKADVSGYAGIWIEGSTDGSGSAVTEKLMVVLSGKTLLGEFQFTAPMPPLAPGRNTYFVAFETFRPFTIRPEPGSAPTKFELAHITGTGILADGTAGAFSIHLHEFAASSAPPAPGPGPSPSPSPSPPSNKGIDLFDFGAAGVKPWRVTNDPVMGGRSKSTFVVGSDAAGAKNVGLFSGDVAIVPSLKAPGFCNAFVEIAAVDMAAYDAIEIMVRSHGALTAFKSSWSGKDVPKDPDCHHPGCGETPGSYKAAFNVTQVAATGPVQRIVIPWSAYTYKWSDFTGGCTDHGAVCCSSAHPEVCPTFNSRKALSSTSQIGIWGEGTAGDFALDIFSVRAIKL